MIKIIKFETRYYEELMELMRLWKSDMGMSLHSIDDSQENIEKFIKRNPNTCFLCKEDNVIVGGILAGHDGRRGYIYHTIVAKHMRFKGIGRELVDAALNAIRFQGIHKVALVVSKDNKKGNNFWESLGFTERVDLIYRDISLNSDND